MTEVALPSGAILKIQVAPFGDAKALYQAVLEELRAIPMSAATDIAAALKDIACAGFSSKKIEARLDECLKRCLFNDLKIDKDTFEPLDRRGDYIPMCIAVMKENILPFAKGLYAEYGTLLQMTEQSPT